MSTIRRSLVGLTGAVVVMGGIMTGALHLKSAQAQVPEQRGIVRCGGNFTAQIPGVNAALELSMAGRAMLEIDQNGSITGQLQLSDGSRAEAFGQTVGRAINLLLQLDDGRQIYGVGTSRSDMRDCSTRMGGPAVTELADYRSAGRWLFEPTDVELVQP